METEKLYDCLNSSLRYLSKIQNKDGSFLSLSSPYANFKRALNFHSVFSTALISQILSRIGGDTKAKNIQKKTVDFLLSQKSSNWSWNYWNRTSKESQKMPYPDDLDDTFCAMSAIYLYDTNILDGEALAHATQLLTLLEIAEGGPYKTWLVEDSAAAIWKDVDLGVNANIGYFLSLLEIELPNLSELFSENIKNESFITPYYPSPYPVIYFISRFLTDSVLKIKLIDILLKLNPKNSLDLAVKVSSLINLGYPVDCLDKEINKILSNQSKNGSWKPHIFYTGVNPNGGKKFYAGSSALTTAFCIEAISSYLKIKHQEKQELLLDLVDIHKLVIDKVKNRFDTLGAHIKKQSDYYLKRIIKNDTDGQITLLPFYFSESLDIAEGKSIPKNLLVDLGAASVYGWIAYTIYDDFLDGTANTATLPLANLCLRELTYIFNFTLGQHPGFTSIFHNIMDSLEETNTWEVNVCKFEPTTAYKDIVIPDYKDYKALAGKSMGHALGCVAVLMYLDFKEDSVEVQNLLSFFQHFLIARQLNDDAHDWEQDLKSGHVNSVAALLLKQRHSDLNTLFWESCIDDVCDLITWHANIAKKTLPKFLKDPALFSSLVGKQEKSVEITKKEKANALAFVKTYPTTP